MALNSILKRLSLTILTANFKTNFNRRCYWKLHSVPKVSPQIEKWNKAVEEASELVPQNSSVNGFSSVLGKNDQMAKLVRQVVGSKHPLLHEFKNLLSDTRMTFQIQSLISLLVAKAAGHAMESKNYQESILNGGITKSQTKLADAIQLCYTHFASHSSVLNLNEAKDGKISKTIQKTNGIAVLLGDYFAAYALGVLAAINNQQVLGLIAHGQKDFSEAIFSSRVDRNGNLIPDPESPFSVWETVTFLEHASLLSRGCEGMMVLAGHGKDYADKARDFGKYVALAIKVNRDIEDFRQLSEFFSGAPFRLSLAPVILHLQNDKDLLERISNDVKDDVNNLDFVQIHNSVKNGASLKKAEELLNLYICRAEDSLRIMGPSPAACVLLDMLHLSQDN